jgi:chaperonin cofactor prefoldin
MIKRLLCLSGPLLFAVGCDLGPGPDPVTSTRDPEVIESNPQEAVSPPTGIVRIQEAHDLYKEDVASVEKAVGEDGTPSPNQVRTLRQVREGIGHLKTAAIMGRDNQNRENLRNAHGLLLRDQSKLLLERRQVWIEITEIEQYLTEIEKGTGSPPAGFTEPELKDRITDAKARADAILEKQKAIGEKMSALEARIKAGDFASGERSLFTDELAGLERLEARITALLDRTS